jgi:ubiquitin carboxyl-terminal hydrolase 14
MVESSNITINVKWGKEIFKDVEVDLSGDVECFRAQLYALSNVPVDKQKINVMGQILKDDDNIKAVFEKKKIQPGSNKIQLLGAAEDKVLKEGETVKFYEDMTPAERRKAMLAGDEVVIPPGLTNLGNTCYMNSVV